MYIIYFDPLPELGKENFLGINWFPQVYFAKYCFYLFVIEVQ